VHAGASRPRGSQRQGISVPKILVADDNTNIQKMVSLALEERGISVVSVGNGEAAVRRIPDVAPDLVLADIFMPVRNGYEVCEFVKKDDRFAHVPVILLVGAFDPLDEKEARRVGADGVLKKPFVPPDPLIAMVTSALEKNPRVAAELAKAKEVKAPAPEPEPLPNLDLSSRPEPKPLPEFPEPSAEEAELVYGMGKGQRSLDSTYLGDTGPAAPSDQAVEDEESDAASTTSDWRRSAMDLEIPAELAGRPAIPSMDELEPVNFPSEKDYPPRHVSALEPVAETPKAESPAPVSSSSGFSLREVDDSEPQSEPSETFQVQTAPEAVAPMDVHAASDAERETSSLPEPNSTAAGGHWLDALSSAQAESLSGGWMGAANSQQPAQHAETAAEPDATERSADIGSETISGGESESFAPPEASLAYSYSESRPQLEDQESHAEPGDSQSFFADEAELEASAAPEADHDGASSVFVADSGGAGRDIELEADDAEPSLGFKDPALVEPPAVHVTPEPLLVPEESGAPAGYGASTQQNAPARSIFAPVPDIPAASAEFSVQAENSEPSGEESNERIPTMPPPNREALSHIPFLTPPPSFLAELNSSEPQQQARQADPETVDTVVQKVLEKLQPQLQELLSQSLLKPLVENVLQDEITKKK
jgi:CheY-like chemotaxis protein